MLYKVQYIVDGKPIFGTISSIVAENEEVLGFILGHSLHFLNSLDEQHKVKWRVTPKIRNPKDFYFGTRVGYLDESSVNSFKGMNDFSQEQILQILERAALHKSDYMDQNGPPSKLGKNVASNSDRASEVVQNLMNALKFGTNLEKHKLAEYQRQRDALYNEQPTQERNLKLEELTRIINEAQRVGPSYVLPEYDVTRLDNAVRARRELLNNAAHIVGADQDEDDGVAGGLPSKHPKMLGQEAAKITKLVEKYASKLSIQEKEELIKVLQKLFKVYKLSAKAKRKIMAPLHKLKQFKHGSEIGPNRVPFRPSMKHPLLRPKYRVPTPGPSSGPQAGPPGVSAIRPSSNSGEMDIMRRLLEQIISKGNKRDMPAEKVEAVAQKVNDAAAVMDIPRMEQLLGEFAREASARNNQELKDMLAPMSRQIMEQSDEIQQQLTALRLTTNTENASSRKLVQEVGEHLSDKMSHGNVYLAANIDQASRQSHERANTLLQALAGMNAQIGQASYDSNERDGLIMQGLDVLRGLGTDQHSQLLELALHTLRDLVDLKQGGLQMYGALESLKGQLDKLVIHLHQNGNDDLARKMDEISIMIRKIPKQEIKQDNNDQPPHPGAAPELTAIRNAARDVYSEIKQETAMPPPPPQDSRTRIIKERNQNLQKVREAHTKQLDDEIAQINSAPITEDMEKKANYVNDTVLKLERQVQLENKDLSALEIKQLQSNIAELKAYLAELKEEAPGDYEAMDERIMQLEEEIKTPPIDEEEVKHEPIYAETMIQQPELLPLGEEEEEYMDDDEGAYIADGEDPAPYYEGEDGVVYGWNEDTQEYEPIKENDPRIQKYHSKKGRRDRSPIVRRSKDVKMESGSGGNLPRGMRAHAAKYFMALHTKLNRPYMRPYYNAQIGNHFDDVKHMLRQRAAKEDWHSLYSDLIDY
jgi:hypothetical protein